MGVMSSPGQLPPRTARRTVWSTSLAMVIVPIAGLVLIWAVVVGAALGGAMAPGRSAAGHGERHDFLLVAGIGLVIALASVALTGLFTRRLAADITRLEAKAQRLASAQLPELLKRLRQGEQGESEGAADQAATQPQAKTAEIASTEAAIASLARMAVAAAAAEAGIRGAIGKVFVSLARRNQSLLQRQLHLIDVLEQKAPDPATLADLFPLDHLTTRMRRHAEGLIILSGAAPGRSWSQPVPVIDVIRGAVAEVEDYRRVTVLTQSEDAVAGMAAADMIHLLAELIENATLSSPSGTKVGVRAGRVANGLAIEVDDRGLGIEASQLQAINEQLTHPPDFDLANADQLGLFVVGKLAARHGVRVALRPSPYGGTTAVVLMPSSIVVPGNATDAGPQAGLSSAAGKIGLDLGNGGSLALPGGPANRPSLSLGAAGHGGGPPAPAPRTADAFGALPRRIRQASLNPRLRDSPAAASPGMPADTTPPADARTPEGTRDLVASLQSAWHRGRGTDSPEAESVPGSQTGEPPDSETPYQAR